MSKPNLIIIGAGGHAQSCIDVIEQNNQFQIAGIVGLMEEQKKTLSGYKVIASNEELKDLAKTYEYAFVAIGQIKTPKIRQDIFEQVQNYGFKLPAIVSPYAYVSHTAQVNHGTIIMHGAIVNAGANIGKNCIINSHALIEHGTSVGSHCHISTGVILNGNVSVGDRCFIGSGSRVKQGITIGVDCIVGMGLNIHHKIADMTIYNNF